MRKREIQHHDKTDLLSYWLLSLIGTSRSDAVQPVFPGRGARETGDRRGEVAPYGDVSGGGPGVVVMMASGVEGQRVC